MSLLENAVDEYCKSRKVERGYNKENFIDECGFPNRQWYYDMLKGKHRLSDYQVNKISEKLQIPAYMVFIYQNKEQIKIRRRKDVEKPARCVAGKICWNMKDKKNQFWERQIMLYNQLRDEPLFSHPVWAVVCKWDLPSHVGGKEKWENYKYFLFDENEVNTEEYVNEIVNGDFGQVILNIRKEKFEKIKIEAIKKNMTVEQLINSII